MNLVRVEMTYMRAGVIVDTNNICVSSAPILRWTVGKKIRIYKEV